MALFAVDMGLYTVGQDDNIGISLFHHV